MISVCIPVYNVDVRPLVRSLMEQASALSAEIILIDDGSEEKYREMNRELDPGAMGQSVSVARSGSAGVSDQDGEIDNAIGSGPVKYLQLEENIGRSRIRNRFTEHTSQENLLFLDCDSVIQSDRFLANYEVAVKKNPGRVICGGRIYAPESPARNKRLHWKYGTRKESQPVEVRKKDPNYSFMTNNFLIPVEILKAIPFNEKLSGYGHEDSLFGFDLAVAGHGIIHIDNPVIHGELQSNREFLIKTREAVHNLARITAMPEYKTGFTASIKLLRTVQKLEARKLAGITRFVTNILVPFSRFLFRLGCTSLRLLDVYKLGLYLRFSKQA